MKNKFFERFELAASNFGRSCFYLNSNEKSFQGWLTSMVIQEFGISKVYRDVDVEIEKLFKVFNLKGIYFPYFVELVNQNQSIPDILVSWETNIDTRNESIRDELTTTDFLNKFGVISELKVTGSTVKPTSSTAIKKDICKLAMIGYARKKSKYNRPLKTLRKVGRQYMVIVDNFRNKEGELTPKYEREYFENFIISPLKDDWLKLLPIPEILLISPYGKSSIMHIYSNFKFKESL